jgi:hypothetical protein
MGKKTPPSLVLPEPPGKTPGRQIAEAILEPGLSNAIPLHAFATPSWGAGEVDLSDMMAVLKASVARSADGDTAAGQALLTAQAATLNQIFVELARRSAANLGVNIEVVERYLRLALKAQSQCRATLETLATIQNPPMIFARQANVTTGPQQINNGTPAVSCAREIETGQNKLLDLDNGQRLDARAARATSGADPAMATVGALNRPSDG